MLQGRWNQFRDCFRHAAISVDARLDGICPFGFELSPSFPIPEAAPRRLYAWLHLPPALSNDTDRITERYVYETVEALTAFDAGLGNSLKLLRWNRKHTVDLGGEAADARMLNVLARPSTSQSAIEDYGLYLIGACASLDGALGERLRFAHDTRARRRLFQLYEICRLLAEELAGKASTTSFPSARNLMKLYADEFEQFRQGNWHSPPTGEEAEWLKRYVQPIAPWFRARLCDGAAPLHCAVADAYLDQTLTFNASAAAIEALQATIETTYFRFGAPEGQSA